MPGVKGRSGGARPGAGRKPAPKPEATPQGDVDMLQMLQNVALGKTAATALQVRAAIAAVQYTHTKRGDGGVKEERQRAAQAVAEGGRFGKPKAPLKLIQKA